MRIIAGQLKGRRIASPSWDGLRPTSDRLRETLFNVLAPEAVVIGGGVSAAGEQLFGPLRERVRARMRMLPPGKINILQASLGGDSALHGAVILGQAAAQSKGTANR